MDVKRGTLELLQHFFISPRNPAHFPLHTSAFTTSCQSLNFLHWLSSASQIWQQIFLGHALSSPFLSYGDFAVDPLHWICPRAPCYVLILNSSGSLSNRLYQENPPGLRLPYEWLIEIGSWPVTDFKASRDLFCQERKTREISKRFLRLLWLKIEGSSQSCKVSRILNALNLLKVFWLTNNLVIGKQHLSCCLLRC